MVRFLAISVWLCLINTLFAQYHFQKLSSADGLSQSSIQCILQDRKGFLWFGSMDGLNRYDGYGFKVYRSDFKDPNTLSNNDIRSVFEDSKGRLWIGTTTGGLNLLDRTTEKVTRFARTEDGLDIQTLEVSGFTEDSNGTVWVIALNRLLKIDQYNQIHTVDKLPLSDNYTAILIDQEQRIWIGSGQGDIWLSQDLQAGFKIVKWGKKPLPTTVGRINQLAQTQSGKILCSTTQQGLFAFNEQKGDFESVIFHANEYEGRNFMRKFVEDKRGKLWITCDAGIIVTDAKTLGQYQFIPPDSKPGHLSSHALQTIYCDAFGNIWLGIWEGGINVVYSKPPPFEHYSPSNSIRVNKVTGLGSNEKGIWVATSRGIVFVDEQNGSSKLILPEKDITTLYSRGQDMIVPVWHEGFYYSGDGGKTFVQYNHTTQEPEGPTFRVQSNIHFHEGYYWIGVHSGQLLRFDPKKKEIVNVLKQSIFSLTSITTDEYGTFWIGTYNQGIWRYFPRTGEVIPILLDQNTNKDPNQRHINNVFCDRKKRTWVGTNGSGLYLYNAKNGGFRRFSTHTGLPNDVIRSIQDDAEGKLWVATNEGICCLDVDKNTYRTFSNRDGLKGKEFFNNLSYQAPDGRLFFGGMHGVNYFYPSAVSADQRRPRTYFTNLRLLNQIVAPQKSGSPLEKSLDETTCLHLSYTQARSITFDFVALFFQPNHECTYAYKLEGFNQDWIFAGKERSATYTNLNPGHYTFRVKAANSDGVWDKKGRSLEIRIAAPWYLSWFALLIYLSLIALALWFYRDHIRKREALKSQLRIQAIETENIRELDQMKTNFFTNISHELRTPLTLILDPIEQLSSNRELGPEKTQERYAVIRRNASRLVRLVNQLLDLSKIDANRFHLHIDQQDIRSFLEKVVHSFDYQAEKQAVVLVCNLDFTERKVWFDADALEKIIYNLLSNALKATTKGGEVSFEAQLKGEEQISLEFSVQDTGHGISPQELEHLFQRFFQIDRHDYQKQAGTGVGLALTKELIKIHGGDIQVESELGHGSKFRVQIPVYAEAFPAGWLGTEQGVQQDWLSPEPTLSPNHCQALKSEKELAQAQIILIADDNEEMRNYLEMNLGSEYTVMSAENGKIAHDLALKYLPNLIVSDLLMPEMDGFELCKALKNDEKTSHIPFVLLTSRSVLESQLTGLETGADDYLTKPFHFKVLAARIRNLLEQRQRLQAHYAKLLVPGEPEAKPKGYLAKKDELFLQKIIGLIEENIADINFNVDRLELALGMSKMQLYRKLQSLTNMSGNAYIRHVRLMRAQQLLETSNLTVAEVAYQVGFNTPSYFTKSYKKEFGKLPSE
jgi:signal transduction histidine kinase/ligand-binding sensor domain-containing protein/DNA-binding response OmpR family regulator